MNAEETAPEATPLDDPTAELADITQALRAHLEFHAACGSFGIEAASADLKESRWGDLPPLRELGPAGQQPAGRERGREPSRTEHREPARHASAMATRATPPAMTPRAESPPGDERIRPGAAPAPVPSELRPVGPERPVPENASARLVALAERVAACQKCSLHEERKQTVFARGSGKSGVCFIGEGPGADEDAQGLPFVGKAGQLLDRMIVAMGLDRDDVYVCNIVKCRPPNNRKPQDSEMAACIPHLHEQIELLAPKVIVALGGTAVQGLLGTTVGITRLRGQWRLYQGRIPVMPTFHPAYLLRNPAGKREVWEDLQNVLRHLGVDLPPRGGR